MYRTKNQQSKNLDNMPFIYFIFALIKGVFKPLFFTTLIAIIIGFPIKWLWNWVAVTLFALPQITFWQSLGLYLLCHMLLGFKWNTNAPVTKPEPHKP